MNQIGLQAVLDDKDFQKGIKSYQSALDKAQDATVSAAKHMGSALAGVGKAAANMAKIGIGIAAASATALAAGLATCIGPASDLNETVSKVGVVFGDQADAILAFGSSAATALGMSKNEALAAAATYGNLFRSMGMTETASAGMSKGLVELAADLASFNNMNPTEVLDKLRAGLTGETEPLKSLGVNLSAAAVQAKAMQMGLVSMSVDMTVVTAKTLALEKAQAAAAAAMKKGGANSVEYRTALNNVTKAEEALADAMAGSAGDITAAAKAQATYALVMEQTSLAQGDFARTSTGLANQQRILSATFTDIKATIGTALLPALSQVATLISTKLASPAVQALISGLASALGKLFSGDVSGALASLSAALGNIFGFERALAIYQFLTGVKNTMTTVFGFIRDNVVPILTGAFNFIRDSVLPPLRDAFETVWGKIREGKGWITANGPQIMSALNTAFDWVVNNVLPPLRAGFDLLTTSIGKVKEWIVTHGPKIMDELTTAFDTFKTGALAPLGDALFLLWNKLKDIKFWIEIYGPKIMKELTEAFNDVKSVVVPALQRAMKDLNESFGSIRSWIEENGPLIRGAWHNLMKGIVDNTKETTDKGAPSSIPGLFEGMGTALQMVIDDTFQTLGIKVRAGLQLLNGHWKEAGETLEIGQTQHNANMQELVNSYFTWWHSQTDTKMEEIKTAVGKKWDEIKGVLSIKILEAKVEIGNKWEEIKTLVGQKLEDIKKAISSFDLKGAAADMINSFISGIEGLRGAVMAKAAELAAAALEAIKKVLRMGSPSQAMIEIGYNTGKSYADGINNSSGIVEKAMGDMGIAVVAQALAAAKAVWDIWKQLYEYQPTGPDVVPEPGWNGTMPDWARDMDDPRYKQFRMLQGFSPNDPDWWKNNYYEPPSPPIPELTTGYKPPAISGGGGGGGGGGTAATATAGITLASFADAALAQLHSAIVTGIYSARVTPPATGTSGQPTITTYNLSAYYKNPQSEGSLLDTVRLLQAGVS